MLFPPGMLRICDQILMEEYDEYRNETWIGFIRNNKRVIKDKMIGRVLVDEESEKVIFD